MWWVISNLIVLYKKSKKEKETNWKKKETMLFVLFFTWSLPLNVLMLWAYFVYIFLSQNICSFTLKMFPTLLKSPVYEASNWRQQVSLYVAVITLKRYSK